MGELLLPTWSFNETVATHVNGDKFVKAASAFEDGETRITVLGYDSDTPQVIHINGDRITDPITEANGNASQSDLREFVFHESLKQGIDPIELLKTGVFRRFNTQDEQQTETV